MHENNLGREDKQQPAFDEEIMWTDAVILSGNKTAPVCTTTVCNQAVCFQNNVTLSILYLPKMKLPVKSSQVVGWYSFKWRSQLLFLY